MRREHNEDAFLARDDLSLYGVADGMGGHAAGEIASEVAIESLHNVVRSRSAVIDAYRREPSERSRAFLRRMLVSAIENATYMVYAAAEQEPERKGMGTTITSLLVVDDVAMLASVGDSRAYLIRGDQSWQVTEDHTVVQLQLKAGLITPEAAKTSARGHVLTRAVGPRDHVQVDVFEVPTAAGDRYVLCSDGLHGYIEQQEFGPIIEQYGLRGGAQQLIDRANRRGGKDNITCVIVELTECDPLRETSRFGLRRAPSALRP